MLRWHWFRFRLLSRAKRMPIPLPDKRCQLNPKLTPAPPSRELSTTNLLPSTIDTATFSIRGRDVTLDKHGCPLFNAVADQSLLKQMIQGSRCNPATPARVYVWLRQGELLRWPNPQQI